MAELNGKLVEALTAAVTSGLDVVAKSADELKALVETVKAGASPDATRAHMVVASATIGNCLSTLASVYAWHTALAAVMEFRQGPEPVTIEELASSLTDDVVGMTAALVASPTGNPLSTAWRTLVAGALAQAIRRLELLAIAENTCRELCTVVGVPFESFQAGEPNACRLVMEEALRRDKERAATGLPQNVPDLATVLGLADQAAPEPQALPVG